MCLLALFPFFFAPEARGAFDGRARSVSGGCSGGSAVVVMKMKKTTKVRTKKGDKLSCTKFAKDACVPVEWTCPADCTSGTGEWLLLSCIWMVVVAAVACLLLQADWLPGFPLPISATRTTRATPAPVNLTLPPPFLLSLSLTPRFFCVSLSAFDATETTETTVNTFTYNAHAVSLCFSPSPSLSGHE